MDPVSEGQTIRSCRDELVAVFLAGHVAEFVKSQAVEDGGRGVGGGIVFRGVGGGEGGTVDGLGGEGEAGVGGDGVAG